MTVIKSTFAHDAQGWTLQGDAASEGWQATGGDPGGNLHWVDAATGAIAYWNAPAEYLGDQSAMLGGKLSYAVEDTGGGLTGYADVELVGANGTTLYGIVGDAGTDWTKETIKLSASGDWHVGSYDGAAATKADFKGVLADVSQLLIRAEYVYGDESGGLDDVKLSARTSSVDAHTFAPARLDAHSSFASALHGLEHLAIA